MRLEKTCRVLMAPVPAFVMYYWTRVLPSDKVRLEANRLFQLGFGARLLFCPPRGPEALDRLLGPAVCEKAWTSYLGSAEGKTILDGAAYPDTPEPVVDCCVNELLKLDCRIVWNASE